MSIALFQITPSGNNLFKTRASTLDEITRELPPGYYTTFTTLCTATKVLGLHMHLQRLYVPAAEQGIIPNVNELALRQRIAELAKTNLPKESRLRLILTKDNGTLYVVIQPFEPLSRLVYQRGVMVITTKLVRQAPRVKDTGFIVSSISQRTQVGGDIFEILLTKGGRILEGMTSNFYAIKGKTLVTAQRGILLGVTRRLILRLARGQGMSIEYRAPNVHEKYTEAFLTSSSRGVVPVISIDGRPVGQGKVGSWTKILTKEYQVYVEKRSELIVK